ncbi:MAG: phosphoglycerate kinase [Polyangiaceae bacterium UTPRO1]|jgi:phosphoglycerate kinase|nr:phosphoglycerate kinase [Myxococcales bacterium]OQY66577.1 MAG: phosphoglycerate kinase [Polyangiaceae bacterium UTPRO1]
MTIRYIDEIDLAGKRAFVRADFNVPLKNGAITDATRIEAALPTVRYAIANGARVVLASHLGRPKGASDPKLSLRPVAAQLTALLRLEVKLAPDCVGAEVEQLVGSLERGQALLLENLRFHPEEEKNDPAFARQLAALADVYVNDAFGAAHRAHASTEGMARLVPLRAAGFLMKKEVEALSKITGHPERPLAAILGGAKVSDKIKVIEHLLTKVNTLLIGGAMAYTFLRARGEHTGDSLVEDDRVEVARQVLARAEDLGVVLRLPTDHLVSTALDGSAPAEVVTMIPGGKKGVDIGPATVALYREEIAKARTIFWNGPMGIFEVDAFSKGTMAIADALADSAALTVVGGGDSIAALARSGRSSDITHISTGGGASLEFLEGRVLPGLAVLES